MALTSVPAKCLERLIIKHIKEARPSTLDPYQFAYRENRSTEDAIAFVLHTLLEHLELKNTYVRMLFVDYSSAFNTIRPYKLRSKLHNLVLNTTLCNWMVDFLTNRTQYVRIGGHTSSTLFINMGAPKDACLAHCFTPFLQMTVVPFSHQIILSNLRMTPRYLGSLTTTMRQHIGMRYSTWHYGVITIAWFLTLRRPRELL